MIQGRIRVTARRPGFVDEEQAVLKSGEVLTLDSLSHIRAFAPAKERLRIIGEGSRGMDEIIPFDRELRLRPLIPLIEQALAASNPARPIDGEVTVEFFGDYSRSLRVKRFSQDTKLQEVDGALILLSEERGQLVRRPLCEPWREEPVELLPSTTLEGHAVVSRMGWVGPQILYWRDGNRVITRPSKPYDGSELPADLEDTQSLAWAACRPDSYSSREALNKWHAAQDTNQSAATICKVAASLNGLSAVALNFMLEAPQESLALALLEATADQLSAVWDLQRELSFSWSMIPLKVWRQGIRKWMQPFKDRLDDPIVRELLDSMLQERVEQIAGYDPILQVILERASSSRHNTTVTDVETKDRFQALARSVAALADDFHRPPIDRFPKAIPQAFRVHTDEFGEEIQEVIRCAAGFAALVGRASAGRSDGAALQEHRQIIHAWRRALDRTFDNVALMFLDHHLRFWTPT